MNDKITLSRQQWELIKRYIIYTEHHRQDEIEDWYSVYKNQPSAVAKDALTTWQEFDEGLKKLLDTIE